MLLSIILVLITTLPSSPKTFLPLHYFFLPLHEVKTITPSFESETMNTNTFFFTKQANLLRLLKTPFEPPPLSPSLRHLCSATVALEQPPPSPPQNPNSAAATELIQLLQSEESNFNSEDLHRILPSITPSRLPILLRRSSSSTRAFNFLQWVQTHSPTTLISPSLAYQSVFELASREPEPHEKLSEFLQASKDNGVSLSPGSASVLIRHYWKCQLVDEAIKVFDEFELSSRDTHLYNSVLRVLYKSERFEHAQKVFDEMLEPGSSFPPDEYTVTLVFSALLKRNQAGKLFNGGNVGEMVRKLGEHGLFPEGVVVTKLVGKLCRDGDVDQAWEVLHALMKLDGPVEVDSCNTLLTGLSRGLDFDRMNVLMAEMKESGIDPDVKTFGVMVNHLCKLRRVDEAMQVLDKMLMKEENSGVSVVPDLIMFNTVITGLCKVGRPEEGMALMNRMKLEHGFTPNVVTYNGLIDGFCKAGKIERARELFEQMKEEGLSPDVFTLNTLVGGMCKHGRTSTALQFFKDWQTNGLKGNAVTYTALISAFCNVNNIDKAVDLFDDMLKAECTPDSIVYFSLINGLCRAGKLDDAYSVVSKMKSVGFCIDAICYNTLINGFCKKKRFEKVHEILEDMKASGIRPNEITYNTMIASYSKSGDLSQVSRLLAEMADNNFVSNVMTYGAVIHGFCNTGNLDDAMKIFSYMGSTSEVLPNTVIYNILIDSLCKENRTDEAVSLMNDMQVKGVLANVSTYNAMFKGLRERNSLDKAFELMNQMNEQACDPDYITMEILTEWLSAVGQTDRLRRFVDGYPVPVSSIVE